MSGSLFFHAAVASRRRMRRARRAASASARGRGVAIGRFEHVQFSRRAPRAAVARNNIFNMYFS